MEYDSDKLIPTYGFGAEINEIVEHAFPLSGRKSTPELFGITSVMDSYKSFV